MQNCKPSERIKGDLPILKALLSRIRAHRVMAPILIILAILSSAVLIYSITGQACPQNSEQFQDATMPPRTVFQVVPPAIATICMTVRIGGLLPLGGLSLTPSLGLYTHSQSSSTYSACTNSWTDCGGATVSASPAYAYLPAISLPVVITIDAPTGSTHGAYWLWFWACSGGTILSLRIGNLNQTLQNVPQPLACPFTRFQVSITFRSYGGMIPVYQNGTYPFP